MLLKRHMNNGFSVNHRGNLRKRKEKLAGLLSDCCRQHHVSTMLNNLDHLALIRHTDTQVMRHVWKQGWYKLIQNSSIWKIKIDSKYLIFYTQKNL